MKLHYNELGEGSPVIILHGFLGSSDNWLPIGKTLSEKHEVYLVDQRNHGLSPHSSDHNYHLLAHDLHDFIHEHGIADPVLLGHSMGGKTVMHFASLFPDAFKKLIIADIAPRFYPARHTRILEGLLSIDLSSIQSRNEADEQLAKYVKEESIRMFLLKNLGRKEGGFTWKANLPVLQENLDQIGQAITGENITRKPVFFIKGNNSDYITPEDGETIRKMFPTAKILGIKNAGHWLHAEQREAFLNVLASIL